MGRKRNTEKTKPTKYAHLNPGFICAECGKKGPWAWGWMSHVSGLRWCDEHVETSAVKISSADTDYNIAQYKLWHEAIMKEANANG
jgi:transcription elongation factor Elf1